jgi:hypothetical protein
MGAFRAAMRLHPETPLLLGPELVEEKSADICQLDVVA